MNPAQAAYQKWRKYQIQILGHHRAPMGWRYISPAIKREWKNIAQTAINRYEFENDRAHNRKSHDEDDLTYIPPPGKHIKRGRITWDEQDETEDDDDASSSGL